LKVTINLPSLKVWNKFKLKRMRYGFILILVVCINCTQSFSQVTSSGFFPAMYKYRPRTILIMPIINRTNNKINEGMITSLQTLYLNNRGYYTMPANVLQYYIKKDSIECLPDIDPAPCHEFHDRFGIDALLFVSVKAWEKAYSESTLYEEFEYSLVSTLDGHELWFYDILVEKNSEVPQEVSKNSYAFWTNTSCGIFTTIIASAITTKFSSYNKTAEEGCLSAFQNLPAGIYNNRFLLDSLDKVTVKNIWQSQIFGNRLTVE